MTTASFEFAPFSRGGPKRPLVPFEFPKATMLCLIDSGASTSLISESIREGQGIGYEEKFRSQTCEGICGESCLQILGVTELVQLKIKGISKPFGLRFQVMPDKNNLKEPVIGQDFFGCANVNFQDGRIQITIK